jgi:cysteinyl-tRNA synthetase, unknown class
MIGRYRPWLALVAMIASVALASAASAQTPTAPPRIGSWGYQLSDLDPGQLAGVPYDAIVIDYSRDGRDANALTPAELQALQRKPDGSRRIVLAYFSIGEAESYRYYWQRAWSDFWIIPNFWNTPTWRAKQNGDWGGNYAVRYWDPAWQDIIVGRNGYLERVLKAGFDGVWLDKVDSSLEDVAKGRPTARADMIALVSKIAVTARAVKPGFMIVPQNGEALLSDATYLGLIDGFGKESLLYGEDGPGKPNPPDLIAQKLALLRPLLAAGKPVFAVEYLNDRASIDAARVQLTGLGMLPHFAERDLSRMRVGDYPTGVGGTGQTRPMRLSAAAGSRGLLTAAVMAGAIVLILLGLLWRWRQK